MRLEVETHCHTISSGHAYSTVQEVAEQAKKKSLKAVAITDHGPLMPGGPNIYYIINQKVIPESIDGVEILKGVEANIVDYTGNLDINDTTMQELDIVIASLHNICLKPGTEEENTSAIIGAMENPNVDIIGHPGNPVFPVDKELIVKKAKETGTLIEINNSSFLSSRVGSYENCREIALLCKKHGVKVACGSDAHISFDVGRSDKAEKMLSEIGFDEELIANRTYESFAAYFKEKGKTRFQGK